MGISFVRRARFAPHPGATVAAVLLAASGLATAGCGSSSSSSSAAASSSATVSATASSPSASSGAGDIATPAVSELSAAERPAAAQFPSATGRSLEQLGTLAKASVTMGAATGTFTPGTRRYAFALTTNSGRYVYAPTAIYIAASPSSPARGPFLAPADPMGVAPQYRSKQNSGPGGIAAIYAGRLPVPHAGTFALLALTRGPGGLIGATGEVAVAASSPIPDVGQRPPDIATDTLATVHGDQALLTTRLPPEHMASVSFAQVLGKRPIALLFSTPQLCVSRVCGPVTDVAVQLQHTFGTRVAFIHEEVYVDNNPSKGLRPQLRAFHLRTEPWLFAINRQGIIVARLEGALGTTELTQALEAALR
ncbi:MAG TPA: hypothetical protein VHX62_14475 [Solirubrobacteraceae bacterium]|nr:hypothetical protein [Solirubrobacteraceae bacterium]